MQSHYEVGKKITTKKCTNERLTNKTIKEFLKVVIKRYNWENSGLSCLRWKINLVIILKQTKLKRDNKNFNA